MKEDIIKDVSCQRREAKGELLRLELAGTKLAESLLMTGLDTRKTRRCR